MRTAAIVPTTGHCGGREGTADQRKQIRLRDFRTGREGIIEPTAAAADETTVRQTQLCKRVGAAVKWVSPRSESEIDKPVADVNNANPGQTRGPKRKRACKRIANRDKN